VAAAWVIELGGPGGDPRAGLLAGAEAVALDALDLDGELKASLTALSNADPTRAIGWMIACRSQAVANALVVYSLAAEAWPSATSRSYSAAAWAPSE
jgi:hypothetical protein